MPISEEDKQFVRKRANYLCEYCHSSERVSPSRFTTDNLALACRRCNERRYNITEAVDPQTKQMVPLFNPRKQVWQEHFIWANDNTVIEGITAIGRAMCQCLDLNDERYLEEDSIRATRHLWVQAGLHPPREDL